MHLIPTLIVLAEGTEAPRIGDIPDSTNTQRRTSAPSAQAQAGSRACK